MAVDAATMAAEAATQTGESTAAPTDGGQAEATTGAEDMWARVLELDPDELIRRNPRLQGKLGAMAQQQSQRATQEAEARYNEQIATAREAQRVAEERSTRRRLAETDPDALAAKVIADEARAEWQEQQKTLLDTQRGEMSRAIATRLDAFYNKPIFKETWEAATPDQRTKLSWTNYREIDDFFEAAAEIISDHRSEKKAEVLAQKRLEALQKEHAVEAVKAEAANGRADLNLDGLSTGEHIFSQSEIKANVGNSDWRKANLSKVNAQAAAGLIRQD